MKCSHSDSPVLSHPPLKTFESFCMGVGLTLGVWPRDDSVEHNGCIMATFGTTTLLLLLRADLVMEANISMSICVYICVCVCVCVCIIEWNNQQTHSELRFEPV